MSYDLSFMPRPPGGDWDAAVDAQELRAEAEPQPATTDDRERFDVVERAVRSVLPDVTRADGESWRQLVHEAPAVDVSAYAGFPGEVAISVPYWYDEGEAVQVVEVLRRLAAAIEEATGLVAYDPQAGAPFLGRGERHAAPTFGKIDRLLRSRRRR